MTVFRVVLRVSTPTVQKGPGKEVFPGRGGKHTIWSSLREGFLDNVTIFFNPALLDLQTWSNFMIYNSIMPIRISLGIQWNEWAVSLTALLTAMSILLEASLPCLEDLLPLGHYTVATRSGGKQQACREEEKKVLSSLSGSRGRTGKKSMLWR